MASLRTHPGVFLKACVGMLALATTAVACCATNSVEDGRVLVSGTLADADVPVFLALLDADPRPTTVVFDHCLGGTLSAAYGYARAIRQRELRTIARHQVSSGCALAYLAGVKRGYDSSAGMTAIALHVGRKADGSGPSPELVNMRMLSYMIDLTDRKLSEPVQQLIARSWSEASGVMFLSWNYFLLRWGTVVYCDGTQGRDLGKCLRLDGVDAFSQGIITER